MREVAVLLWDDLIYALDKTKEPADVTVRIGLDDEVREIDLTEEHYAELQKFLRPYLDAGHRPETPAPPVKRAHPAPASSSGKRMTIAEFARQQNIKYRTPAGHYSYNNALREAYAEAMAGAGQES